MPTPFAELEARVNAACLAHLANAVATWQAAGGGALVDADAVRPLPYFERTSSGTVEFVDHVTVAESDWPLCASGDSVSVSGIAYRVLHVMPERSGGLKRVNLAPVLP